MSAELMLECSTVSILIIEEREDTGIVIGVPHHAPKGIEHLRCKNEKGNYRVSDENAGFLGRYVAEKLDACSVIACNYTFDVNKYIRSDYSMQIAKWDPKFLVEIHGHGKDKKKIGYDIVISSGSRENSIHSEKLATKLNEKFSNVHELENFNACGIFGDIPSDLRATQSATITDGRWTPFHIELPSSLRKPKNLKVGKPPIEGYKFCDCLVEALNETCHKK